MVGDQLIDFAFAGGHGACVVQTARAVERCDYTAAMMRHLPIVLLSFSLAAACGKEGDSKTSEAETKPTKPATKPAADPKPAEAKTARADWSKLFANGPCVLTADEVGGAIGASGLTAEPLADQHQCTYSGGDVRISLVAPPLGIRATDKQLKGTQGEPAERFYKKVDIGVPTVPTTWRGKAYSLLQLFTAERMVTIKMMYPLIVDKTKSAEVDEKRKQMAVAIAKLLAAKAK